MESISKQLSESSRNTKQAPLATLKYKYKSKPTIAKAVTIYIRKNRISNLDALSQISIKDLVEEVDSYVA